MTHRRRDTADFPPQPAERHRRRGGGADLSCSPRHDAAPAPSRFDELDAKITAGMKTYAVPGAAVAVWAGGQEYVKGYGVTDVDHPVPVDGDTVFRIGSTTKTFTGTTIMRLVDEGKVALDAPVREYLPDFAVADEVVSAAVTVRQLLNHTSGWLGDDVQDFGSTDDALARYVGSLGRLPQLNPPGAVFAYNNAGLAVAAASSKCSPRRATRRRCRTCCSTPAVGSHALLR